MQEINATANGYILESNPEELVNIGPVYWSTELNILSFTGFPVGVSQGIESWLLSFDTLTYVYLLLSIFLVTILFQFLKTFADYRQHQKKVLRRRSRRIRSKNEHRQIVIDNLDIHTIIREGVVDYTYTAFASVATILEKYVIRSDTRPTKILATWFIMSIFILISGYFLNLISVDMVAIQSPVTLDTLHELANEDMFKQVKIMAPGGVWHEAALRGSIPNSSEYKVWERIAKEGKFLESSLKPELAEEASKYALPFLEGKSVAIIDSHVVPVIKATLCQFGTNPETFHTSKEWFGERLLVPIVSRSSDARLLHWIRFKYRQLFQSFLLQNMVRTSSYRVKAHDEDTGYKVLICLSGEKTNDNNIPDPFGIHFFFPVIRICFIVLSFSFISLIVEINLKMMLSE